MKTKRTYRLSQEAVATVKRLSEDRIEPTQDAVVERAIRELARQVDDMRDALRWGEAASDPAFQREAAHLSKLFQEDDRRAWER
ncbi:MAG: hypothetical protein M3Q23_17540 [Actinomycetota bacterium]|nr:hypothetical protein [Actinomycetota bacterium]